MLKSWLAKLTRKKELNAFEEYAAEEAKAAAIDAIFMQTLEEKRQIDPLIGAKLAGKEVFHRLLSALKTDKGVHTESLLSVLAALAGYACQASARAQAVAQGLPETALLHTIQTQEGKTYFIGEALDQGLFVGKYSVWSLAAGAAQSHGCQTLPDIEEIVTHVAGTIGTDSFGQPRMPEGHDIGTQRLEDSLKMLWPTFLPLVKKFCPQPTEWPWLYGIAIQEALDASKGAVPPELALRIVMECAIPMAKVDLKSVQFDPRLDASSEHV